MNLITDTWRGLVRRKLWPVALLLVGALVAIPFTLAKTPDVEPVPANLAAAPAGDEAIPATYVTSAAEEELEAEDTGKRRRTLGSGKDPFEPAPLPKAKKKKKTTVKKSASAKTSARTDTSTETEPTTGGGTTAPGTAAPAATPTATPKPAPLNSIRVRFSKVTDEESETPKSQLVERFEVLPDEKNPVLVYRGVEDGGKVAVFELTGNVTVEGDGECEPTPENCQFLRLRAGETEFVTVTDTGEETDAQYQIDLVKINAKK